ncbi:MAG: hypothetical protein AMXMBFR47_26480 [Planctomycetota bacterium]
MRTAIGHFWRRLNETTIWRYAPDTPPERLLHHHRRAMAVAGFAIWSAGLMFAATLEMLLSEPGWWRVVWFCVICVATPCSVLSAVPGIIAGAWARETARECAKREIAGAAPERLDAAVQKIVLKTMGYAVAIVLVVNVFGRDPALRPAVVAISTLLTAASLVPILRTMRSRFG